MSGIFPVSIDLWKISCRMGANSLCNVWRTMGLNLSGPAALCGLKPLSSLSMPSAAMLMSGIFGWGLGWNGRLAPESCKSCSDFWARDFKLMGVLGLNTDWNWSFKAFAFPTSVKTMRLLGMVLSLCFPFYFLRGGIKPSYRHTTEFSPLPLPEADSGFTELLLMPFKPFSRE